MRRFVLAPFLAAALVLSLVVPAGAITYGEPDGGAHPQVGQLLFYDPSFPSTRFDDPGGWFNCSGTLLSSTVVLTAGHCSFGIGDDGAPTATGHGGTDVWVTFLEAADYSMLAPSSSFGSNAARYAAWEAALDASPVWHRGTAHPHPDYVDAAFFLFDVGVIVLDAPFALPAGASYGQLPGLGMLDTLAKPKGQSRFTAVGYGLEKVLPWGVWGGDTRMTANVMLVNLKGVFGLRDGIAATFSNNNGAAHRGGTCFGDSGGPIFAGTSTTVVAVTSFGVSPNCTGNGGGYRIDQPDDLAFLQGFLP